MGRYILLTGFLFFIFNSHAQDFDAATWRHIDTSVSKKKDLSDIYELVQQLKQKAFAEKKYFQAARCYYYQLLITDQRSEDSFYFRNSAFIDSLLMTQQDKQELQLALHVLQAKRLLAFTTRSLRFNRQRYERNGIPLNYAAFTNEELDSIAQIHFELAKTIAKNIPGNDINEALWLSSDPLLFLFKPALFDIVIAEQINHLAKKYYYPFPAGVRKIKFMLLSPDDFIENIDSLYTSDRSDLPQLKYYKEWLAYHRSTPGTYYFIETLARKFAHEILNNRNDQVAGRDDYEVYLQRIASSPYTSVKAHGVYQLCLLWNQQANKYFPSQGYDYDYLSYSYRSNKDYDTAYRYHAVRALRLFQQNKAMLDSFIFLKNILLQMEKQVLESEVNMVVESYNLPGEPMLAELNFKNADKLYYSIVRRNNGFSFNFRTKQELIRILRQLPEVENNSIDLPPTDDHNQHEAYLKLDALPSGSYDLLFSHLPLSDSNKQVEHLFFRVTSIAVINNDKRVFILDRKTGFPLAGAKVKGSYERDAKDTLGLRPSVSKNYTVNEKGFVTIDDKKIITLDVYYNNDTLSSILNIKDEDEPEGVYSKEEYDGLADFYEENASVHIYTDRSIYRPGQTVFFKAIFLTKNKNTGEAMVMNKENMKGPLFSNVYKKLLKESEPEMYLTDPFGREMDTIKITMNEYGSLSDSFKIPKTAATGSWSIGPDDMDEEGNGGSFRVEEYKRPSYEISIETPKKELLPKDTFSFKVKVKSFAGAALNNVQINYTVERSGYPPVLDEPGEITTRKQYREIIDTFAYTNAEGELEIKINDSALANHSLSNASQWDFYYKVEAEAVDVTGESYETNSSVLISSRPTSIKLPFDDKYNRDEKNSVLITASDRNAGKVSKNIKVKIYRLVKEEKLYGTRNLVKADQWLYDKGQLQQWFPLINILNREDTGTKKLILETIINTGKNEKLDIDPALFAAGNYVAEAVCEENGMLRGENKKYFSVFSEKENKLPQPAWSFYHLPYSSVLPGDTIKYYNGNSEKPVYSIYYITWYSGKKKTAVSQLYETMKQESGIYQWKWKVPAGTTDQALVTQVYVLNNQVFTHEERIFINNTQGEPEIIIEQYRKKLSPGSKETFSVSIKTKNENTAAELMTTMYDASLDKLEKHNWEKPRTESNRYLRHDWDNDINSPVRNSYYFNDEYYRESSLINPGHTSPFWWINPLDYNYDEGIMGSWNNFPERKRRSGFQHDMNPDVRWSGDNYSGLFNFNNVSPGSENYLMARIPGVQIASTEGLDEVVVVGYGTSRINAKSITGSVIHIRGSASLTSYNQPLIILDGVIFEGDLGKLDPNTITQAVILKGADASAIYGARAANGVLVLSTKGEIVFPALPPEPTLPPRKNFNETAFFFPAIHADKEGYYSFTFTMPESVTEWNWKMMAHTKKAVFAYAERKLNTQLPLMVQPNMPRLLYQGDRIVLQSRITNLDSIDASGKAVCKIEDAVTGEDITSSLLTKTQNDFSVGKKANVSSAFKIKVPKTQLNPLKIVISVRSQNFADGEEHIIPVLSPKILVRENIPFRMSKNMDTILQAIELPAGAELYGVGISILPKPQSALINALPYLANYSFDCAEQTFNKLLAHVTAMKIMRTDKEGQQSFDKAKQTIEKLPEQKEMLPDELSEQTMPWLNLDNKTARQQKQLFELLDTSTTVEQINKHLNKLYKLQNGDGGLTWFEGGKSNSYISNYVLAGFGKLVKDNLAIPERVFERKYKEFIEKLLDYCDNQFVYIVNEGSLFADPLFYTYARSFWKITYPLTDSSGKNIRDMLGERWQKIKNNSLYSQAILIITTLRYFDKGSDEYQKAIQQLNSIEQLAIKDDVNGIRWKDLADNDEMSNAAEETLALIAAAFSEAGIHPELSSGIIKWLLAAKNEDHWSSTKATSAVIGMLSKENNTATGVTQTVISKTNNKELSVTDDLLSGNSFSFVRENKLSPVELKKQSNATASGNIMWYYFSAANDLNKTNKEVNVKKELFRFDHATSKWEPVNEKTLLKIADKIKVILTIETSKALKYVYIDDKRAAAFEPKENHSGYEYGQGFSYYQSVRDAGLQFFSDFIPSGRSTISYEMIVAQEGNFTNGPASLQCMYKPEVNAYSNGSIIQTIK